MSTLFLEFCQTLQIDPYKFSKIAN